MPLGPTGAGGPSGAPTLPGLTGSTSSSPMNGWYLRVGNHWVNVDRDMRAGAFWPGSIIYRFLGGRLVYQGSGDPFELE